MIDRKIDAKNGWGEKAAIQDHLVFYRAGL